MVQKAWSDLLGDWRSLGRVELVWDDGADVVIEVTSDDGRVASVAVPREAAPLGRALAQVSQAVEAEQQRLGLARPRQARAETVETMPVRAMRNDVKLEIELVTPSSQRLRTRTRNLSIGGVFVESDVKLGFDTRVQLCFSLPNMKEPVEVGGVVRWSDGHGFGVQFDGLRARDVYALGKFFERMDASQPQQRSA